MARALLLAGLLVGCFSGSGSIGLSSEPPQQEKVPPEGKRYNAFRLLDVAKSAYKKAEIVSTRSPQEKSREVLSGLSREWFKAQVAVAASNQDAVKAATEYLEREGLSVGKDPK